MKDNVESEASAFFSRIPEKHGAIQCRGCFCSKNNDHSKGVIVFQRSQVGGSVWFWSLIL